MNISKLHIDLFCKVVDNYGDAGVCWRLARSLVEGSDFKITLWCDDVELVVRLAGEGDLNAKLQIIQGVELRLWESQAPTSRGCADVVVECLATELPLWYGDFLPLPRLHLNLEHLALEEWSLGCHGLVSRSNLPGVPKYFYYPGPWATLGGLVQNRVFATGPSQKLDWLIKGGFDKSWEARNWLFLFPYPDCVDAQTGKASPLKSLGEAIYNSDREWIVWCLDGSEVHWQKETKDKLGEKVIPVALPFLSQERFDSLLSLCDRLWVRGEDSISRALLAGIPFVWQAYRQAEGVHLNKVEGLIQWSPLYKENSKYPQVWKNLMYSINGENGVFEDEWSCFVESEGKSWFELWKSELEHFDLTQNLSNFCLKKLETRPSNPEDRVPTEP